MQITQSFPLEWPYGRERTSSYSRKSSPFKTTQGRATNGLVNQLKMMRATNIVISSNLETYERAGIAIPYVTQKKLQDDPGVAVYFTWNGEQYAFACDKWKVIDDNIQALNKTVEAIRGLERWGTGEMVKAAFSGFKALPQPEQKAEPAKTIWQVLGIQPTWDKNVIYEAYRKRAKVCHPDAGGTTEKMQELSAAYQQAISQSSKIKN